MSQRNMISFLCTVYALLCGTMWSFFASAASERPQRHPNETIGAPSANPAHINVKANSCPEVAPDGEKTRTRLVPVLGKESWLIAPNPTDLGALQGKISPEVSSHGQEVVDHHIWKDKDGVWRCWACVRGTAVGRIIYGWRSPQLERESWEPTGVEMRRDQSYGESLTDLPGGGAQAGPEWIQSPFVVQSEGQYFLFYGGGSYDPSGRSRLRSICLANSADGVQFVRHRNAVRHSWVFLGPGEARDPCVVKIGDTWFCYYSGSETGTNAPNKIYARTSTDLINWSASREVHWGGSPGSEAYQCECPHVIFYEGCYYLFRTKDYAKGLTYVYSSEDPSDFGLNSDKCLVGQIDVAAPEIIQDEEKMYITSSKALAEGIRLHRLEWTQADN